MSGEFKKGEKDSCQLGLARSLIDSRNPPRPIEIAPAQSSARPPVTTSFELPSDDSPAVKAKGTVRPSERPMILVGVST